MTHTIRHAEERVLGAERLGPLERLAHADALLRDLCEGAWQRADNLTARLREAGFAPGNWPTWESLARLPILHKSEIPELQRRAPLLGGLGASDRGRIHSLFFSPGGILEPDMPTAEARLAAIVTGLGFGPEDVVLNCFSYHLTPAGLLFHNALRLAGCLVLPGGTHNAEALFELMRRTGATGFAGVSSHLKLILDQAERDGRDVHADLRLRKAVAGAEPFSGPIRKELADRYAIRAFDIYGTAEVGIVAFECGEDSGLHLHPDALAEVTDPETGERLPDGRAGHLLITARNPEYPMVRLGTGDLATVSNERCRCGRTTTRITSILGRVGASARVRGMLVHEAEVRDALRAHTSIVTGRIEVSRADGRDAVTAVLELRGEDAAEAIAAFAKRFAAKCRITLDRVERSAGPLGSGPLISDLRAPAGASSERRDEP